MSHDFTKEIYNIIRSCSCITGFSNLSDSYEIVYSNLDTDGNVIDRLVVLQGDEDRKRYFNHSLLFLTLLNRNYNLSIDMEMAYEELIDFVNDQNACWSPGMHFLILKKI